MNPQTNSSKKIIRQSNHRKKSADPAADKQQATKDNQLSTSLAKSWGIFERFGYGIVGILLILAASITLIGYLGFTQGATLTIWIQTLGNWFGWGKYLVVISLLVLGVLSFRWQPNHRMLIHLDRILALELACFTFLAILAILGGNSLDRAESGLDGGIIGWGLASLLNSSLAMPLSTLLLAFLFIFSFIWGTGLVALGKKLIEKWLFPTSSSQPSMPSDWGVGNPVQLSLPIDGPALEDNSLDAARPRDARLPPLNLLSQEQTSRPDEVQIHETALQIEKTLDEFGIPARVVGFRVGPTVTQYAVEPGFVERLNPEGQPVQQKVRVSQISALARDLALALSAERLRIEAPVPGQSFVGIEVPNSHNAMVKIRPLLESDIFRRINSPLALVMGKDVSGLPVVADLARMPHLLIAGTTGSGKTMCIAALTTCLMMNNTPGDLRMVMLDPKKVELMRFNGLPHLLGKVETEIERMLAVLRWALVEMDHRYRLLESVRARDLTAFNQYQRRRKENPLPRIVILVDELADLMMSAPDQTEHSLIRLAQMARATGIHLVVATQRPSTDVITGLIKANFPARLSFTVASSIDSRVILDVNGAETLLGRGDMLFLNPEIGNPIRAQGALVTDHEIERVINFWRKMSPPTEGEASPWDELVETEDDSDDLTQKAINLVKTTRHASASLLQRRLRIGYPRAARLLDELEKLGVVGPAQGGGREREVLVSIDEGDEAPMVDDEEDKD